MTFIKTIAPDEAEGRLKTLYDRITGPDGRIDNIMTAHSLRPPSLEGHMSLYKNVLHHSANTTPKWLLETIGVYVSIMNNCAYCVEHHFEGLRHLLKDDARAEQIRSALNAGAAGDIMEQDVLAPKESAALRYAAMITKTPELIRANDIELLRTAGWNDGEILEINQVAAYFAYANRTVLGLGVTTEGDRLGLSPNNSDDENDWGHQ
ncbi:peroxidase-related enzyme [Hyphococcus flavus]|uniref:Peroxidase-related enzyme n=1 Tax=Hyphococcus flavus TaxID=1866326 RepID=A0AAE9ZAC7_9PROT|nr:peroxidase-related enzyme [Hyphococcus flavus]WDI30514.1 peroxidase-related enzyme [Hyphococcus flavus]